MKVQLHMFLGFDNLSYTVQAITAQAALAILENEGIRAKKYLGAQ